MSAGRKPKSANPYVGPRPFGKSDPLYGRDREVRELRDLLISQRIVVFYSPSGAGKTSLIEANAGFRQAHEATGSGQSSAPAHAGLRWHLERARFRVLPVIRVNQTPGDVPAAGANRYVLSALLSLEQGLPRVAQRDVAALARLTLAEYLDAWPRAADNRASDVLIFDQFEEMLTLDPTDQQAKAVFLAQVGEVLRDGQRWALFSLREDHLGGLDPYTAEIPTHLAAAYRLDLLGQDAARQAMQCPAAGTGLDFTDDAARRLVDDLRRVRVQRAGGAADELLGPHVEPVHLQVVCRRLWDEAARGGDRIDPEIVAEYGNVDRALRHFYADAVETVAQETSVPERIIRGWFDEHLITSNGIRGQVIEEETQTAGLPARAVDALVDRHLVRSEPRRGVQWLELAHDRLIAPILADNNDWYPINLSALQQAARLWQSGDRQGGFLLTGDALTLAEEWAADHPDNLDECEREFLAESRKQRDQHAYEATKRDLAAATLLNEQTEARRQAEQDLRREAEQRAEEQAQAGGRIRRYAAVAASLAAIALLSAAFAFAQMRQTEAQENRASSLLLAKQAEDEGLLASALLLASDALTTDDTAEARKTLLHELWGSPIAKLGGGTGEIRGLSFSPDGATLVSADSQGVQLWSTVSRAPTGTSVRTEETLSGVAFAPDGASIATGGTHGVQIRDPESLAPRGSPAFSDVTSLAYAPDGSLIVAGGADGRVALIGLDSRVEEFLSGPASRVNVVAHSRTGQIAAGRDDGTISLWDTAARGSPQVLTPPAWTDAPVGSAALDGPITAVSFDPTGAVLAAGNRAGTVWVWDVAEQQTRGFMSAGAAVNGLAFSPDGGSIVVADAKNRVAFWSAVLLDPGEESLPLEHTDGARSVAYSPTGEYLASGSGDGTIYLWSAVGSPLARTAPQSLGLDAATVAAFSAETGSLAAVDRAGRLHVCAEQDGRFGCQPQPQAGTEIQRLAFSHNGDRLAVGSGDGIVTILSLVESQEPRHLTVDSRVASLVFSNDDRTLAVGVERDSGNGAIVLWDLVSMRKAAHERPSPVTALASGTNSSMMASSDRDITLWTVGDGDLNDPRHVPTTEIAPVNVLVFDPTGTRLAVSGQKGMIWDIETGETMPMEQDRLLFDSRGMAFSPD
ncbi:MAG: hypothetical protein ACRDJC_05095, partial [Thermomicrobiales bacterium]